MVSLDGANEKFIKHVMVSQRALFLIYQCAAAPIANTGSIPKICCLAIEACDDLFPRHHSLQPRLGIIPTRPLIKDGDAKTPPAL